MENITEIKDGSQAKSALWELAQEGARTMIQAALIQEQADFIEKHAHLLTEDGKKQIVRNGFLPERTIKTPAGNFPVQVPRIRNRDNNSEIQYSSQILPKYLRNSKELDELIPFLYLREFQQMIFLKF